MTNILRISIVVVLVLIAGWLLSLAIPALFIPIRQTTFFLDIKGGGWLGYRLGFAGSVLLLAAMFYSLKLHTLNSKVSAKAILDLHCYLSIAGGLAVLIHSGFPIPGLTLNPFTRIHPGRGLEGLVGVQWIAAWLVLILVVSGVYGKYLYGRRPPTGPFKLFRSWHVFHVTLSGALYVTGVIHLISVLVVRHIAAI